ncbi:MAG TPA: thermonuclease family protein, partial [Candidatus Nanoarchaeia archaeon]
MRRKFLTAVAFVFIFVVAFALLSYNPADTEKEQHTKKNDSSGLSPSLITENEKDQPSNKDEVELKGVFVTRVIDGDTIEIEGGQKVRYIGIDTPETVDPRTSVQCYGKEASAKNKKLVEGKRVHLEKDVSETDKYGRLLRYVFVPSTGSGQALFVNETLVKEGYAFSSSYPPDIKYQDIFTKAEKEAQEADRGLWGSCGFVAGEKTTAPETDCVIKGNISSSGEKIYHTPGQRYYNQTVISESKGERWFCTEEEAQRSGWRKSKL